MARMVNCERPITLGGSSFAATQINVKPNIVKGVFHVPTQYQSISKALEKATQGITIEVRGGTYNEPLNVPNGVDIIGFGTVKINGKVVVNGTGSLSGLKFKNLEISSSTRFIDKCIIEGHLFIAVSYVKLVDCLIEGDTEINESEVVFKSTSLSANEGVCLILNKAITLLDGCSTVGPITASNETVMDCKNTTLVENNNLDIIETTDETTSIQLFNCYVCGTKFIKSGPGTSVRSNVIPLKTAKEFIGGENFVIQSV